MIPQEITETIIFLSFLRHPNYQPGLSLLYKTSPSIRVANCALWFLKLPHSEAKGLVIFNVNILGGSSSVLELLETIGNSE